MTRVFLAMALSCSALAGAAELSLSWTNNLLTVTGDELPGGKLEVWYLEAFCKRGSTKRDWGKTTLPHKTELIEANPRHLRFRTRVQPEVEMQHEIRATSDEIAISFEFHNRGSNAVDLEWFQPACIRVAAFTGSDQTNYINRSFIFTDKGLTLLSETKRTEEALYRGGQVYVPARVNLEDVNPRPICGNRPVNGLIGCYSADNRYILATASDRTQEVFEGVYVCLHSDPQVGGLQAGERKVRRSKIYLLKNNAAELTARYHRDFGKGANW